MTAIKIMLYLNIKTSIIEKADYFVRRYMVKKDDEVVYIVIGGDNGRRKIKEIKSSNLLPTHCLNDTVMNSKEGSSSRVRFSTGRLKSIQETIIR